MSTRASFVIPAYNAERWISKAIHSCRAQTIKQIEIVVVNDGSTDGTKDIIDWHAKQDERVKAVHLPENKGQSYARNHGNKLAQGEYIFVLDADDMATRNRVKDSIACFTLKKCDLLFGSFWIVDSMGNVDRKEPSIPFDPERSRREMTNRICHSTMAYTKKLAMDVSYEWQDQSKLAIDDWRFAWDAHRKGYKFHALTQPLCYYRSLESSLMNQREDPKVTEFKESYLASFK